MRLGTKIKLGLVIAALLAIGGAWVWYRQCGGASHCQLHLAIAAESQAVQTRVDRRSDELAQKLDAIDSKLNQVDEKLDRVEGKLDKLLRIVQPPLPDGLQRTE